MTHVDINLTFWVEFQKSNILHFLTNEYPWDSLVNNLRKSCSLLHFQLPLKNLLNLKKKVKGYRVPMGRLSALNPMEISIVLLIKV